MRRSSRSALIAGVLVAIVAPAAAHVAPSTRENNRYLKVSALGDRLRLAYTIYMGQVPGARARVRLDANDDGRVDDDEARLFGDELAAGVHPAVSLVVDGAPATIHWNDPVVGLGTPAVDAGAFAVDLIGWVCLPDARDRLAHELTLHDRFQIDAPGETEILLEASPGVTVKEAHLGAAAHEPRTHLSWTGGPGKLATSGYFVSFEVDPSLATFAGDDLCAPTATSPRPWPRIAAWLGLALVAIGAVAAARRWRRR